MQRSSRARWPSGSKRFACSISVDAGQRGQEGHPGTAHRPGGKVGENIKIRRFMRYEVGEGLAKRADDFVDEVKRQAGQA